MANSLAFASPSHVYGTGAIGLNPSWTSPFRATPTSQAPAARAVAASWRLRTRPHRIVQMDRDSRRRSTAPTAGPGLQREITAMALDRRARNCSQRRPSLLCVLWRRRAGPGTRAVPNEVELSRNSSLLSLAWLPSACLRRSVGCFGSAAGAVVAAARSLWGRPGFSLVKASRVQCSVCFVPTAH